MRVRNFEPTLLSVQRATFLAWERRANIPRPSGDDVPVDVENPKHR